MRRFAGAVFIPAAMALAASSAGALAQGGESRSEEAKSAAAFYEGRKVSLIVDTSPGGGYDAYGRLLARHYGAHIPGAPTVLVQNMPGAGGLTAANWLAQVAPRDGSVVQIMSRSVPLAPLMGTPGARFDPLTLSWIGSMNREVLIAFSWSAAQVEDFAHLKRKSFTVGVTGPSADSALFTRLSNNLLGTKLNIISGYRGSDAINLAIEQGENEIGTGSWSSLRTRKADWISEGKIKVLVQFALEGLPELKGVPLVGAFAPNERARKAFDIFLAPQEMGRPIVAPPALPADRLGVLRKALLATMADKELLSQAERQGLDIDPIGGEKVLSLLKGLYALDPDLVKLAREAAKPPE
jgi:tripartite-type tricarboxylate transporter receptor subunit TctC